MFCPKCGKENKEGVKFCVGCGAELSSKSVEETIVEEEKKVRKESTLNKELQTPKKKVKPSTTNYKPAATKGSKRYGSRTYRDLTLSQQKEIYLYVTDVPSGPQADKRIREMARKYNISEGDVLQVLSLGTFEYRWGRLP